MMATGRILIRDPGIETFSTEYRALYYTPETSLPLVIFGSGELLLGMRRSIQSQALLLNFL